MPESRTDKLERGYFAARIVTVAWRDWIRTIPDDSENQPDILIKLEKYRTKFNDIIDRTEASLLN